MALHISRYLSLVNLGCSQQATASTIIIKSCYLFSPLLIIIKLSLVFTSKNVSKLTRWVRLHAVSAVTCTRFLTSDLLT